MASIDVVLWKYRKKKDGTCSLAIRITKDRKPQYIHTGMYLDEKDWDYKKGLVKKSHPNSVRLNAYLQKRVNEAHSTILEGEVNEEDFTSKTIKKKIKRKTGTTSFFQLAAEHIKFKTEEGVFSVSRPQLSILHNINEFLTHNTSLPKQQIIENIKKRRKERISNARAGRLNLEDELAFFSKNQNLSFNEIDMAFINRFKSFCSSCLEQKTRTMTNQLIFIRTIYNQAIKENLADPKKYPFGGENEKIRIKPSNKIGLTKEEVTRIENLDLKKGSSLWHTKNIWLFSYYFAGVRISDVLGLKWSDFMDGRLYYQMNKNEKPVSLKIPEQAQVILSEYTSEKRSNLDFVFPFLKKADENNKKDLFIKTRNATSLFNKYLKEIAKKCEIQKNLSNHISRHTFGNIAGDKIHPMMLMKLYRHSNLKTTLIYQSNFIHKEADEALDSVLNS